MDIVVDTEQEYTFSQNEIEYSDLSLNNESDYSIEEESAPFDQTVFVGQETEVNFVLPDAINFETEESNSLPVIQDISGEELNSENSIQESGTMEADPEQQHSAADENQENNIQNESSITGKIYKLLNERLPERSVETEALETEIQESEVSLSDIKEVLNQIKDLESEQNEKIETIESNQVIESNNYYHMTYYQIGILSAIWGSIAIYLFFRKIG